jgi:energy-coupling factor transporter ATP-binding protein EcfA2
MATKKSKEIVGAATVRVALGDEAKPEGLQIIEMRIENIKRIRLAHLKPKGNVVVVAGKNGSGKTSLLDAISWGLTGTSTVPTFPIRKGQRVGKVQIDLGDFIVTRHFTHVDPERSAKGNTYMTKLVVEGKRREQFPNPQTLLNALMGKISFDPLAFTRMDDKEQLKTLRGLVTFDVDVDAVQAEINAAYDERREVGKIFDGAKARLDAMPKPQEGLPAKPIDVETITKKLEGASNHNSMVAATRVKKTKLLEDADNLMSVNEEHIDEIERLMGRIAELKQKIEENIANAQAKHAESKAMEIAAEIDTAALAAEISAANVTNARIARAQLYALMEDEVSDANAEWERLDAIVKGRTQDLEDALARAQMPIEGLGIGDDEVLYNGLPFGQASNAEQIQVSMALAMASNPKLRVLRIADGSLLDDDSFALIAAAAEKHGFQVWIERVDTTGKVGIVMEDGEASGDEVVEEGAK